MDPALGEPLDQDLVRLEGFDGRSAVKYLIDFVWPGEQKLFETSDVAMVEQAKEVAKEAQTARISALQLGWGREFLQRALEYGSKSLFVSTGLRHSEFIAANLFSKFPSFRHVPDQHDQPDL